MTSFHHCVKLRFSNAQCCQALKRRSRFHSVVTDLSHQSRRALPRDWVASKVAVHEDCDLVNMFLSSISQRCFVLSHQIPRCTFSGPNVSLFQQDPICLGPGMKVPCKQICIVLLHLSSESDSVFRLTPVCLVVFSRGVLTALVFVLHPDPLMMSGACLKSSVLSRYCPV